MTNYDQALAEYYRTANELYAFTKDMLAVLSPSYPHMSALEAAKAAHAEAWDNLRAARSAKLAQERGQA
ncbi:hypothetical protein UFOVP1355_46 [uncultured Caudovirales phage]|uniref:Uncharacterized protein n=1 Tax=uncultured Caudovirales phage TaxID=2100421 RepID=A0A6J5S1V8_9CAUD|nr:hypothetical protein UFOVP1355_46 [uncultured Caudovirales phage]